MWLKERNLTMRNNVKKNMLTYVLIHLFLVYHVRPSITLFLVLYLSLFTFINWFLHYEYCVWFFVVVWYFYLFFRHVKKLLSKSICKCFTILYNIFYICNLYNLNSCLAENIIWSSKLLKLIFSPFISTSFKVSYKVTTVK